MKYILKKNMNEFLDPQLVKKTFTFENHDDARALTVSVLQVLDMQYGFYVWPSAVVLAQYVWTARKTLENKITLELGAGVSLPGIVAAKCGAHVILSDGADFPLCMSNCRRSCKYNDLLGVPVVGLTWGEISQEITSLPPVDIILGSDVFYDPEDFEAVLETVSFLLKRNPSGQFWTTYQERSSDWSIEVLLHKWNLQCKGIPLGTFHADKNHLAGSTLPGNHIIQMLIISVKAIG